MASILPSSDEVPLVVGATGAAATAAAVASQWGLIEEGVKTLIALVVEVSGVQFTLQWIPQLSKFSAGTRVLALGLGMGLADALLKYALPIFWGARAAEFSWTNLEHALSANVSLIVHLAFVAAVWLRTRTDLSAASLPVVWAVLAFVAAWPSAESYLAQVALVDSWTLLAARAVLATILALGARAAMSGYTKQRAAATATSSSSKKGQ
jgi:hypothetical protein